MRVRPAFLDAGNKPGVEAFRGKMGTSPERIAPGPVDRIARRAIEKGR